MLHRALDVFEPVFRKIEHAGVPDAIELLAVGAMLHSLYNGIENILKRIGIAVDGGVPRGDTWHRDLLDRSAVPALNRPAVVSTSLHDQLEVYLRFRHRFRHSYSYDLVWEEMESLVLAARELFDSFERQVRDFLDIVDPIA